MKRLKKLKSHTNDSARKGHESKVLLRHPWMGTPTDRKRWLRIDDQSKRFATLGATPLRSRPNYNNKTCRRIDFRGKRLLLTTTLQARPLSALGWGLGISCASLQAPEAIDKRGRHTHHRY